MDTLYTNYWRSYFPWLISKLLQELFPLTNIQIMGGVISLDYINANEEYKEWMVFNAFKGVYVSQVFPFTAPFSSWNFKSKSSSQCRTDNTMTLKWQNERLIILFKLLQDTRLLLVCQGTVEIIIFWF